MTSSRPVSNQFYYDIADQINVMTSPKEQI